MKNSLRSPLTDEKSLGWVDTKKPITPNHWASEGLYGFDPDNMAEDFLMAAEERLAVGLYVEAIECARNAKAVATTDREWAKANAIVLRVLRAAKERGVKIEYPVRYP